MTETKLKRNALGGTELLAQAIALISPTMTAALIVPVMFSNTGNLSWLAYALGTIMLLFVGLGLNQFARRSTAAGSMYSYISRGMGLTAGGIGGWSLIWAYLGIAMAGVTGFSIFAGKLLEMAGISVSPLILFLACAGSGFYCAWKDVQLSAVLMLAFEATSMALIAILCLIVLGQHHFAVDAAQFDVSATPLSGMGLGVVVAIFSLVGFECATAFGEEARDPLKTIPRSVVLSLLVSGVFFVFVTYTTVMAVRGYADPLDKIDAPLNVLTELAHVEFLKIPLSIGAMVSFFALCLSCISAGSRVIYAMGRHGLFHSRTTDAHPDNKTPHVAVALMALVAFGLPTILYLAGNAPLDIFGWVGTLAAFGFLVPYALITIAAPVYLKSLGALRPRDIAVCLVSLALLAIPTVGSVYPVPAAPLIYFPYIFAAYLAAGAIWIVSFYARTPMAKQHVRDDVEKSHGRLAITADAPGLDEMLPQAE